MLIFVVRGLIGPKIEKIIKSLIELTFLKFNQILAKSDSLRLFFFFSEIQNNRTQRMRLGWIQR
jgi:hypothetical protein